MGKTQGALMSIGLALAVSWAIYDRREVGDTIKPSVKN